jgi:4-amino-4-deoxy-L-arabinose transferase-like glycosyltransferase
MKKLSWTVFAGIIILAAILRFWKLGVVPLGFHADEVAYGYNAYSILKTGRDEFGKPFPLVLRSFGDYKAAVDAYLAIPFIYFGGLHEWAVRAPSAVFGILFILLTYALVLRVSKDRHLALVSTVIATISPVGILLSRVQSDPLICATFFFFAIYCWFLWLDTRKTRFIILIGVSIFLSFYTYTITRLFAIPFFLVMGLLYWKVFDKQARLVFCGILSALVVAVIGLYVSPAGVYFSQVNVFSSNTVQLPLDEEIREDGAQNAPFWMTRVIHNKVVAYGQYLLKNYSDYLSFEFLFTQAKQPLREQIPHQGVLMLTDLPFLLVGIYMAFRKRLSYGIFSVLWVLLVPAVLSIASAETPNVHRFILAMIPIYLLVALGIISVYEMVRAKRRFSFAIIVVILFAMNLSYNMHELIVHQPIHNSMYRNDEYTKLVKTLKPLYPTYDIIVMQQVLEHILFYWPVDSAWYQKLGSPRDTQYGTFDKFFFVTEACPSESTDPTVRALTAGRILYVDKAECRIDANDKIIETVRFDNSLTAYYLVEK